MRVRFSPGRAAGQVTMPASKSAAHRALLAAALTPGVCEISPLPQNEDIQATVDCLTALGTRILRSPDGSRATVYGCTGYFGKENEFSAGTGAKNGEPEKMTPGTGADFSLSDGGFREDHKIYILPCNESGSTLRLLLPSVLRGKTVRFTGAKRLFARPLSVYADICHRAGVAFSPAGESLTVCGRLSPGTFAFPGNISSQFVSGLLFALPHLPGDSLIRLAPPVESASYIEMTLRTLSRFGYTVKTGETGLYRVPGGQIGRAPERLTLPPDQSAAAFFGALSALSGGAVKIENDQVDPLQGDRVYRTAFAALSAGFAEIPVADCPDLSPVLMAFAALSGGARLTHTARLRFKESDRGAAMAEELEKCGVRVTVNADDILLSGGARRPTVPLSGHGDHRVVMALSVLLSVTGGEITGAEAVSKSLPEFFTLLRALGLSFEMTEE
ncbi:MAG: 3-phosphoshikimate 1-carboxyvinyltransferase [Clostridia bacterium]|nr:3-phosphoshikimate 1-carboxyvinyltransferase [Clostridia bacterium]